MFAQFNFLKLIRRSRTKTQFLPLCALKSRIGQGMVEYLIIVAIVAVGSISVVKVVGANLNIQLANIAQALGGTNSQKNKAYDVPVSAIRKKDLSNFFDDAVNPSGNSRKESRANHE